MNNIEELTHRQNTDTLNDSEEYILLWILPDDLYTDLVMKLLKLIRNYFNDLKLQYHHKRFINCENLFELRESIQYNASMCLKIVKFKSLVKLMQLFINKKLKRFYCEDMPDSMAIEIEKFFNPNETKLITTTKFGNLVSFSLPYQCTNEIIQIVSNNSPNLQTLDVSNSYKITDIVCLFKLQCLNKLILKGTNVSVSCLSEYILKKQITSRIRSK